ncbi:hypothetical protein [Acaryochloris sp. IP29b_bin.137]|uniref:hypothetical protein n=1 Tax=Acaryochloris sp. IP29b_bin.137 TaxID=2969217 RepID=UPI0026214902|nr:hypothetical protein [Acaryochloris sp. IP29b_bin.137]
MDTYSLAIDQPEPTLIGILDNYFARGCENKQLSVNTQLNHNITVVIPKNMTETHQHYPSLLGKQ